MTQRQIKFRAWDSKAKRFIAAKELLLGAWPSQDSDNTDFFLETETDEGFPQTGFILLQFTGLLDKNGKEIYEGDIVKNDGEFRYQLEVRWETIEDGESGFGLGIGWNVHPEEELEIIGNIYENPDLIKSNNK